MKVTGELESTRPNDLLVGNEREVGTSEIIRNIYNGLCPQFLAQSS